MDRKASRGQVWLAALGFCGVVVSAVFNNAVFDSYDSSYTLWEKSPGSAVGSVVFWSSFALVCLIGAFFYSFTGKKRFLWLMFASSGLGSFLSMMAVYSTGPWLWASYLILFVAAYLAYEKSSLVREEDQPGAGNANQTPD